MAQGFDFAISHALTGSMLYIKIKLSASGTMRIGAAQPRQVRKEATVSGSLLRRGPPDAGASKCLSFAYGIFYRFSINLHYVEFSV